ncbi:MAG: response regulator [Deinococcus sp.]|nr:response regulator [Deinococcus sp.]
MIRVVLAEDQALVLSALSALLSLEDDLDVVGTASDGEVALERVRELHPDVLVTDIEMPRLTRLDLAAKVREEVPGVKVIIVTTFGRAGYLRRVLDVGAKGYLLKDAPASELADAIRPVHAGGRAVDPNLAAEAWGESDPLTERERQVLLEAESGKSTAAIAAALHLQKAQSGITCRKPSANWARKTGWKRRGRRGKRAGSERRTRYTPPRACS